MKLLKILCTGLFLFYWSQWAWAEVVTESVLSFPPEEQLIGHDGGADAVAYSPDGTRQCSKAEKTSKIITLRRYAVDYR